MNTKMNPADEIMVKISGLQAKQADLLKSLNKSLFIKQADLLKSLNKSLFIKSLWPDAFATGSRVRLCIGTHTCWEWDQFLKGKLEIYTGYLERVNDGERRAITADNFRTLHFMPGGSE
jgi:hypothetical protein